MITPQDIRKKAERLYISYLKDKIQGVPFSKIELRANKIVSKSIAEAEKELLLLKYSSKAKKGFGFSIEYKAIKTKTLGKQTLPSTIFFETETDFLKYVRKESEVKRLEENIKLILATFPILEDWIIENPLKIIKYANEWGNLLKVCTYFQATPISNLYIRELPIAVHTKFIEQNTPILRELLELLISDFIQKEEDKFEKRFNLKFQESLVRFRILDKSISETFFSGISDLSIPISEFENLSLPIKRVIIVENQTSIYTTALTLPNKENTITIFGKGRSVSKLKTITWLQNESVEIFYWGDLDVHGFEMLSQTREYFPHIKSVLMDEKTFDLFFENEKGKLSTTTKNLNLTKEEHALHQKITENNYRLEQEKIPLDYVIKVFNKEMNQNS